MIVASPTSTITSGNSVVTISGTLHNISQIMVYIDGVYSTTIPLDFGASAYSFSLVYSPGTHTVRMVGLDPITATQVEKTISVVYDLTLQAQEPLSASSSSYQNSANPLTHDGAVASGRQISESATAASQQGIFKPMLDGVFGFMVASDLIVPGHEMQSGQMFLRFIGLSVGSALLLAPRWSYDLLMRLPFMPFRRQAGRRRLISLRVIGAMLALFSLILFT